MYLKSVNKPTLSTPTLFHADTKWSRPIYFILTWRFKHISFCISWLYLVLYTIGLLAIFRNIVLLNRLQCKVIYVKHFKASHATAATYSLCYLFLKTFTTNAPKIKICSQNMKHISITFSGNKTLLSGRSNNPWSSVISIPSHANTVQSRVGIVQY